MRVLRSQAGQSQPGYGSVPLLNARPAQAVRRGSALALSAAVWLAIPVAARAQAKAEEKPATQASSLLEIGIAAALDRARSAYQNGRYDLCISSYGELFEQATQLQQELAVDAIEQARTYYAACQLALGNEEAADRQFRSALERNPLMAAPDPVLFPGQVRDLFFKVKADFLEDIRRVQDEKLEQARRESEARAMRARLERDRVRQLEAIAATERVVSQNRRWVAALPFGVGQFQNDDDVLGTVFLTSELLLLGSCVAAVAVELNTHFQAEGGRAVYPSAEPFNERLKTAHTVQIATGAGFLVTAIIGIVQAQVAFVPEVAIGSRTRQLPGELQRAPAARAHESTPQVQARIDRDQAWVGIGGQF
jgi:tetratricopeptide (TPR) repeat protein